MTVYILFEDDCETDGPCVHGVYATEELAKQEKAEREKIWGYYYIEERGVEGID